MPKFISHICREPYRLFFPLGILMGAIGVGHWVPYWLGWVQTYSGFFHSSVQVLAYMNCFIIGFLLTAMPRFSASRPASAGEVSFFLLMILGMLILLSLERWLAAEGAYIVWLLGLVRFSLTRVMSSPRSPSGPEAPKEMVWVPIAVLHGITGTVLLMLGQLKVLPGWSLLVGKPMMEQGFLVSVVMGIGGFLIPRLMGTYQRADHEAACETPVKVPLPRRMSVPFHLCGGALLMLSFVLEGLGADVAGYILRAFVLTSVFAWTGSLLNPPKVRDLYVWLIWVSVWMTVIGFWAAIASPYRVICLHIAFIGGFSLMTFAVATMVILSHGGEAEKLHKPLWVLWVVAIGLALALLKRLVVAVAPDHYFKFLGMAAVLWLSAAVTWLIYILPRVFRVPPEDEFAKIHEAAKQRLSS